MKYAFKCFSPFVLVNTFENENGEFKIVTFSFLYNTILEKVD